MKVSKPRRPKSVAAKSAKLLSHATQIAETTTDWMDVFNAIYAPGAIYSQSFPTKKERLEFAQTAEHKQLYVLFWKCATSTTIESPMAMAPLKKAQAEHL